MESKKIIIIVTFMFIFTSLMGCTEEKTSTDDEVIPTINYFNSNKTEIEKGETINLSWSIENSTTTSLSPSIGSVTAKGSIEIQPSQSMTYTIKAENQYGNASESISIIVNEPENQTPAPSIYFSISDAENYLLVTYTDENLSWNNLLLNGEEITLEDLDIVNEEWDGIIHKGDRLINLQGEITLTWKPTDQLIGSWAFS
jgi:hypothetical protein